MGEAPFEPGNVVVCVDASACSCGCGDDTGLLVGRHYRVAGLVDVSFWFPEDPWNVWLSNFDHAGPHHPHGESIGSHRFRKIDDEQIPDVLERLKSIRKQRERIA